MRADVVFYVSSHGFGHATRTRALLAALSRRAPGRALHVRTQAPEHLFRLEGVGACSRATIDAGLLQRGALDLDLCGSLAAHERFAAGFEAAAEREARWLRESGAALVVADVPPLAFAAAARAGLRAVAVANFGWDWILEGFAESEPRWRPIAERYRAAHAQAARLYRLPFHGEFPGFPDVVDAPLLVNRSPLERAACRAGLGVDPADERRLVLVSFGGFGVGALRAGEEDHLSDYLFTGPGPAPPGLRGAWHALPSPAPPHEQLVGACDAAIGKLGYSTVAEVIAHATRFLYLRRDGFRESELLERGVLRHGCAREIPRGDFEAGRWRAHLDALFAQPARGEPLATDGAEFIADALLGY